MVSLKCTQKLRMKKYLLSLTALISIRMSMKTSTIIRTTQQSVLSRQMSIIPVPSINQPTSQIRQLEFIIRIIVYMASNSSGCNYAK